MRVDTIRQTILPGPSLGPVVTTALALLQQALQGEFLEHPVDSGAGKLRLLDHIGGPARGRSVNGFKHHSAHWRDAVAGYAKSQQDSLPSVHSDRDPTEDDLLQHFNESSRGLGIVRLNRF